MAHTFEIHPEALRRRFAVYVVIAQGDGRTLLYIGKTGDNREGCNPLISRCGNHFSYNKIHSQVRNKIETHENWRYTYVFDHFDEYCADASERRVRIDRINEMERWLNTSIQQAVLGRSDIQVLNPFGAAVRHNTVEQQKRAAFRTPEANQKLDAIVEMVKQVLGIQAVVKSMSSDEETVS